MAVHISEQELVIHVFAHATGPFRHQAEAEIRAVWQRCRDGLGMTDPVPRLGLPLDPTEPVTPRPGSAALATRRSSDGRVQGVLRVEHDVLNVSLLLASHDTWPALQHRVTTVLNGPDAGVFGIALLFLGKATAEVSSHELLTLLGDAVPADARWSLGRELNGGVSVMEYSEAADGRAERVLVVLAPPGNDDDLSQWAWSNGDATMPPLARYLMHTAKLRFQLRVHAEFSGAEPPYARVYDVIERLRAGEPAARAELRSGRIEIAHLLTGLRAMRHTVEIAQSNATMALGPVAAMASDEDLVGDDRAVAAYLAQRITDDVAYLELAADAAARADELVDEESVPVTEDHADEPTFGIVTALPEEFVAVREMIDGWQRRPVPCDRAMYFVGTIPSAEKDTPHGVVATLLGDTGNNAAAEGCANLIRSFPTVSCVLMVGIAAGVPATTDPARHVRLGDIVVASWGIVDYDHVVDTPHGEELRQSHPRPSSLLRHPARLLEADERAGRRPWEAHIEAALVNLSPDFVRPPAETDRVFGSDSATRPLKHPDPDLSGHRPGHPKVHHGRIGSAERSLRNVAKRDALAIKHGLRAIEMEGTGIGKASFAGGLEWHVIRGISDYGDRRTGTRWRQYAALVAAAYTKALLGECQPIAARGGHIRVVGGR